MLGLPLSPLIGCRVVTEMFAKVITSLLPNRSPFGLRTPSPGKLTHQSTNRDSLLSGQLGEPRVCPLVNLDHFYRHDPKVHHWYTWPVVDAPDNCALVPAIATRTNCRSQSAVGGQRQEADVLRPQSD